MTPFGVLADDLTGACDTGVQFSARGARVLVLASPEAPLPQAVPESAPGQADPATWQVVVLNTESRHLAAPEAAQRASQAAARLTGAGYALRYKKIDSTLRGPWVAELAPLLAAGSALLLAPAFPAARRTVQSGLLLVEGVPVSESEIGRDRLNPVPESHLPTLLEALGPAGQITLTDLVWGLRSARQRLAELRAEGVRLIVADAAGASHLEALAGALAIEWQAGGERAALLAAGSAGLAGALAEELLPEPAAPALPPDFPRAGPVLALAGSSAAVTHAQVQHLRGEPGVHALELDAAPLDDPDWERQAPQWIAERAAELRRAAQGGARTLALSVAPGPAGEDAQRFAQRSVRLNAALGALVAALAAPGAGAAPLGGLVLTGGDIARSVLGALGGDALQLGPQVLPGIALGWPVAGAQAGLPVITKAGAFGAPDALGAAVHFLRHGSARSC